jgi:cyclophilin family peptidyl-prolyl cis-trans isomerase
LPVADSEVVAETNDYGRIVLELYPTLPEAGERFKLINEKFYDGTAIHRIDPNLASSRRRSFE